jgi:hypothetical protein
MLVRIAGKYLSQALYIKNVNMLFFVSFRTTWEQTELLWSLAPYCLPVWWQPRLLMSCASIAAELFYAITILTLNITLELRE